MATEGSHHWFDNNWCYVVQGGRYVRTNYYRSFPNPSNRNIYDLFENGQYSRRVDHTPRPAAPAASLLPNPTDTVALQRLLYIAVELLRLQRTQPAGTGGAIPGLMASVVGGGIVSGLGSTTINVGGTVPATHIYAITGTEYNNLGTRFEALAPLRGPLPRGSLLIFGDLRIPASRLAWVLAVAIAVSAFASIQQPPTSQASPERAALLARFDNPQPFLPRSGAGGTEWDANYRTFIQTDEAATSKGLPTHAVAARQILADAAKSPANVERHLGFVLHIKHFSQAYRPESATADLRALYEDLVDMALGAKPRDRTAGPVASDRLSIHRDVVYGTSHPAIQKLDAYIVKSDRPTPVMIEFHGGGWRRGSKDQFLYAGGLIEMILAAGISIVAVDYRLAPEHVMPSQTDDAVRAVQFVRSKAREWSLDPARVAAMGGSSGAHLSAWVALHDDLAKPASPDPVERQSSRLAAFVDISGPMDLLRARPTELAAAGLRGADFAEAFTGAFAATAAAYETDPAVRARVRDASPLFLVSSDDPPAFIMHGAPETMSQAGIHKSPDVINDPHSAWHGVLLADALQKAGVVTTVRIGPEVGKDPAADNRAILAFLAQWLAAPRPKR